MKTIQGGQHTDNRGTIRFVNDFDMAAIRRFYTIEIPDITTIRAWQGHKKERKFFFVLRGSFSVATVKIDNWENPSPSLPIETTKLSMNDNLILAIEGGFANGIKALEPNSVLLVFSDMTTEESKNDDFRFPTHHWKLE